MATLLRARRRASIDVTWSEIAVHGGGAVTGFAFANDGTAFCRNDTSGAFKWDGSRWQQLTSAPNVQSTYNNFWGLNGVSAIQVVPDDSNTIYIIYGDLFAVGSPNNGVCRLEKSTDGGLTFYPTAFTNNKRDATGVVTLSGNNITYKLCQNKIGIDPADPDTVYVTNPGGVAQVSHNGGDSFSDVPDLPSTASTILGAHAFLFDTSSGTTGGRTNTIYCVIEGSGFWQSTDAGVSFSQVAGTGTAFTTMPCQHSSIGPDGVVILSEYVHAGSAFNTYRWDGSWTKLGSPLSVNTSGGIVSAAHPTRGGVVFFASSSTIYYSSDHGDTLTSYTQANQSYTAADTLWWQHQTGTTSISMGAQAIGINPGVADEMLFSKGQGICTTSIGASAPSSPIAFTGRSAGIDQCVCNSISHSTGNDVIALHVDLFGFQYPNDDLDTPPDNMLGVAFTGAQYALAKGWSAAVDPQNPDDRVLVGNLATMCGYSHDGGGTWTAFATLPFLDHGLSDGQEVIINNGVILWNSSPGQIGFEGMWYRSDDWGDTWTPLAGPAKIPVVFCTVGGTAHAGDALNLTFTSSSITNSPVTVTYTVQGGDTLALCATGLTAAVNANADLIAAGVVAQAAITVVRIAQPASLTTFPTFSKSVTGAGATTTLALQANNTGFGQATVVPRKTGCADSVDPDTFYLYNWQTDNSGVRGIYKSTDAGVTFSSSPIIDPIGGGGAATQMECVPGREGYLFLTYGFQTAQGTMPNQGTQYSFFYSTDGGSNWSTVPGMKEVCYFGFGKPLDGYSDPSLMVAGFHNLDYGFWLSPDLGAHWWRVKSSQYENIARWNDRVQCIEGDKDIAGRFYVGFFNSGAVYCDLV